MGGGESRGGAVVVFSGGQDSTTCLALAQREHGREGVRCITFCYGQRHGAEVEVACSLAQEFGVVEHKVVELASYGAITSNALLDHGSEIRREVGAGSPNTEVDGRNMLFLLMAAIYAKQCGVREIYAGMGEADSSGYPDCREVFVRSCNETLNLAMDYEFRVVTPLMWLSKAEVWGLADELGIVECIAQRTVTCYNGVIGSGCGSCPSCELRQRGYEEYLRGKRGV